MNFSKTWTKSKTILFNLSLALAGSWTLIEASLGNLRASITPTQYGIVMAAVGITGVVLRLVTTRPIGKGKQP